MRTSEREKQLQLVICIFLSAITLVVFWNVQFHDFIFYDDPVYVIFNTNVHSGLNLRGFIWAMTTFDISNWHPVTWLSFMLDYRLFRLNPAGYHWTNLIIHIANTLLLFAVFQSMTKEIWKSAFVAVLFAIHPLHVESVAWISERKGVLSAFFWFLTMWAYIRYTKSPNLARYILLCTAFVLGLMAKPVLVTLPFVLLLLDVWPLKRLSPPFMLSKESSCADFEMKRVTWLYAVREKLPLFFFSIVSCVLTYLAQDSWKAVGSLEMFPLDMRIANALISYIHYIIKMFWPANLAFFYPYTVWWSFWHIAGAALLIVSISAFIFKYMRKCPYLFVGWFWYLGALVPVIGIIQVGSQAMADRYTYIPLIGLFVMIAWGIPDLCGDRRFKKPLLAILSIIVVFILSLSAWQQVQRWQNSITLFEYTLSVTSGNYLAHNNLGVVLFLEGRIEESERNYYAALQIKPDYADAHNNLGVNLAAQGKHDESIYHFKRALAINPNHERALVNLKKAMPGMVNGKEGKGTMK